MGVSPAGYYARRSRSESLRMVANRASLTEIRRLHVAHRETLWRTEDPPGLA
ncbi:MAG TPA: hypothetical protein VME69_16195 [Methylocella sp.]|nr:hypothetical protein [Methylocella sp.]